MDAVTYLKTRIRICSQACGDCPFFGSLGCRRNYIENDEPEKSVEIVEKWSKEHPHKTYLTDFLEKHPNAKMNKSISNYPLSCALNLGYCKDCKINCCDCWNTPMED